MKRLGRKLFEYLKVLFPGLNNVKSVGNEGIHLFLNIPNKTQQPIHNMCSCIYHSVRTQKKSKGSRQLKKSYPWAGAYSWGGGGTSPPRF